MFGAFKTDSRALFDGAKTVMFVALASVLRTMLQLVVIKSKRERQLTIWVLSQQHVQARERIRAIESSSKAWSLHLGRRQANSRGCGSNRLELHLCAERLVQ